MLNAQAIHMSIPLAEQLDAAGVVLNPLGGSPLDHMVKATGVGMEAVMETNGPEGVVVDVFEIERAANEVVEEFGQSRHDFVTEEATRVASIAVQNVISIIRNRVAPQIGELVNLVNMRMNGLPMSQLARIQIVANEGAEAMFNPALHRLIEKYELLAPAEPVMNTALPRLSASEIMPLLETGIASLDSDVHEWLANVSPATLETIWAQFFSVMTPYQTAQVDDGRPRIEPAQQPFNTLVDSWPYARIVVFLIARHLLENDVVLEGTEMSLSDMRKTLEGYVEQSGRLLNRHLEKLSADVRNGILVSSMNHNEIVVNTPVYNAWLQNGGDNDVLFGMAVSGTPTFLISTISERSEEFRAIWKRHVQVISSTESSTRFNYLREQLVLCYEDMVSKEENDNVQLTTRELVDVMSEFKNQLDALTIEDTKDIYRLCLKLVCRTRYANIPAERFLVRMDEISKNDPALGPKETAFIATMEYICDWLASQFVVTGA